MNWITTLNSLIGRFWTRIFHENAFIDGVRSLHAKFSSLLEDRLSAWFLCRASKTAASGAARRDTPFPIYLLAGRPAASGETGTYTSLVTKPAASVEAILGGTAEVGATLSAGGWTCDTLHPVKTPDYITDHVLDWTRTLICGIDYECVDGCFLFHVNPSTVGFPEVAVTDGSGTCLRCWKVFGWAKRDDTVCDAVSFCESPDLVDFPQTVWDMHQNGASVYLSKRLLADVSGAVVCDKAGTVERVWTEQGRPCCRVAGLAYCGKAGETCMLSAGDEAEKGDVLFGGLVFYESSEIPSTGLASSVIPGVRIRTDAGELTAGNSTQAAVVQSSVNILPLSGDSSVLTAYRARCVELASDVNCPQVPVPASVNPFMFVMKTLRKGRSAVASMTVSDIRKTAAALACIRRNMPASGILDIYAKASGDTVGVTVSGFTAEAGNAAVSVDATVTVKNMAADAGVVI